MRTMERTVRICTLVFVLAGPGSESATAADSEKTGSEPCREQRTAGPIPSIRLKPLMKGLNAPVALVAPGDGSLRLFVVEQGGIIRIWKEDRLFRKPFLDIRSRVTSGGEKGLLGLAFHPRFRENGRFFVNYTSRAGGLHTVVSEFRTRRDPNEADRLTERILLTIPQPYGNHNGGQLAFGPEGALYIATGDGGAGNDPHGHAQNPGSLLGKILRIDVDTGGEDRPYGIPPDNPFLAHRDAAPEVWAYGLRNPWRFSFDPVTGRLLAGDVGQNAREEIDIIRRGRNYGWNVTEGSICTPGVNLACDPSRYELPMWDYPRPEGSVVIGGHVYRGSSIPALCGVYLYADFGNGRIFGLRYDGSGVTGHSKLLSTHYSISSFGQDEDYELYVVDLGGNILKVAPSSPP
jgi:glucose/arabinose dehydrogenase